MIGVHQQLPFKKDFNESFESLKSRLLLTSWAEFSESLKKAGSPLPTAALSPPPGNLGACADHPRIGRCSPVWCVMRAEMNIPVLFIVARGFCDQPGFTPRSKEVTWQPVNLQLIPWLPYGVHFVPEVLAYTELTLWSINS